jgi:hypothetical protein
VGKFENTPETGTIVAKRNDAVRSTASNLWSNLQHISAASFGKGVVVTGIIVLATMALVGGYMGSIGGLWVGAAHITTLEAGIAQGLSKAVEFMTHSLMGVGTLAAGGMIGAVAEVRSQQNKLLAAEAERLAKELENERSRAPEKAKEPAIDKAQAPAQQPQAQLQQPAPQQPQVVHHHHVTNNETNLTHEQHNNNVVAAIQNIQNHHTQRAESFVRPAAKFSATELTRRSAMHDMQPVKG